MPIYAAYSPAGMRLVLDGIPLYPRSVTIINRELPEDFARVMGEKCEAPAKAEGLESRGMKYAEC